MLDLLKFLALIVLLVAVIYRTSRINRKRYLWPYLFFIRFPLAIGAAMTLFPILAIFVVPEMLKNVFILNWKQILVSSFLACYGGFAVLYNIILIWQSTPFRVNLHFDRATNKKLQGHEFSKLSSNEKSELLPLLPDTVVDYKNQYWALIMVGPLGWIVVQETDGSKLTALAAYLIGIAAAFGLRTIQGALATRISDGRGWLRELLRGEAIELSVEKLLKPRDKELGESLEEAPTFKTAPKRSTAWLTRVFDPYRRERIGLLEKYNSEQTIDDVWGKYLSLHWKAGFAATMWILIYLAGFFTVFLGGWLKTFVSSFSYLVALLAISTWILGFLSFRFDNTRFPITTLAIVALVVWKTVFPSDYLYRLEDDWHGEGVLQANEALDIRDSQNDSDHTLIVVSASGGGITAAYWTTTVLAGLGSSLKESMSYDFHDNVALVSGVSGGAVGTMYYTHAFDPDGPSPDSLLEARESSGMPSLDAVTWGIVYPDFARLVFGDWLGTFDRARAQESVWDDILGSRKNRIMLGDWEKGIREGWRPIPVFNSTLEESGERFLLTPVAIKQTPSRMRHDFRALMPDHDVGVSTAARLSATFPYVAPQARPDLEGATGAAAYHCADGGYYDNSGIVSALDILTAWLDSRKEKTFTRKIAFIEILAGERLYTESKAPPKPRSFLASLKGPLSTIFNVRGSSQVARNLYELELFEELRRHEGHITFQHFLFQLGGDNPLSWHLTEEDKARIRDSWKSESLRKLNPEGKRARFENEKVYESLEKFLATSTDN